MRDFGVMHQSAHMLDSHVPHTYNNYQYQVILGLSHFSLTGTVSTSPNLAKEGARSVTIITRPLGLILAKFGEVDTVPVSENSFNIAKQYAYCRATHSLFS